MSFFHPIREIWFPILPINILLVSKANLLVPQSRKISCMIHFQCICTLTHPWAKNEQIPIKRHVTSLSSEVCRLLNKCTNSVSCRRYLLIFLQIHWKWIMQEIFLDWGTSRFALLTNKIFMGSIGNQISRIEKWTSIF
jgi:hypothetical protein